MDIEKAFYSLDYSFLISVLKKFVWKNIAWVEILLQINNRVKLIVEQLPNILT